LKQRQLSRVDRADLRLNGCAVRDLNPEPAD
jgi:hypothetical protein